MSFDTSLLYPRGGNDRFELERVSRDSGRWDDEFPDWMTESPLATTWRAKRRARIGGAR